MDTKKYTQSCFLNINLKHEKESSDLSPEDLGVLTLKEQTKWGFHMLTIEVTLIRHTLFKLGDTVICK